MLKLDPRCCWRGHLPLMSFWVNAFACLDTTQKPLNPTSWYARRKVLGAATQSEAVQGRRCARLACAHYKPWLAQAKLPALLPQRDKQPHNTSKGATPPQEHGV